MPEIALTEEEQRQIGNATNAVKRVISVKIVVILILDMVAALIPAHATPVEKLATFPAIAGKKAVVVVVAVTLDVIGVERMVILPVIVNPVRKNAIIVDKVDI